MDCYALGALLGHFASKKAFNWKLHLIPVTLVAGTWWLLKSSSKAIAIPELSLFILLAVMLVLFGSAWMLLRRSALFTMAWRTIRPYAVQAAVALFAVAGIYAAAVSLLVRGARASTSVWVPAKGTLWHASATLLLLSFLASPLASRDKAEGFGLAHFAASTPLWHREGIKRFEPAEFAQLATKLELIGNFERPPVARFPTNYPNVFLIVLESSYNRYPWLFGAPDETQPLLKKYQDRMELFPNFYSTFPNSFHARFSVLSGLYPTKKYVSHTNPRIEAPSIMEILHARQYATSVYQSDPRDYTRFADYVGHRKVDTFTTATPRQERKSSKPSPGGGGSRDPRTDEGAIRATRQQNMSVSSRRISPSRPTCHSIRPRSGSINSPPATRQ